MRKAIPLKERPVDYLYLAFFFINILYITYVIDLEQLVIKNVDNFSYPGWPLAFMIDQVHWWGRTFDPLLMARPVWWQATIWLDVVLFGPFYVFAIYAFIKGKEWIRIPAIMWSCIIATNVFIIMNEEFYGPVATPHPLIVTLANASWFIFPVLIIWKMWKNEHPFTVEVSDGKEGN